MVSERAVFGLAFPHSQGDATLLATPPFVLRLPATVANVSPVLDALEVYAADCGIPGGVAARLALVAEEIVANVAMHAEGASFFEVRVTREGNALLLAIDDDGPGYDPLARAAVDTEAPLEAREAGGLGVHLIREMTQQATYHREDGLNRLRCTLSAGGT